MEDAAAKRVALARRTMEELLTAYFLRCFNALPKKKAQVLEVEIAPILRKIFNLTGTWDQLLFKLLELPPDAGEKAKRMYASQPAGTNLEAFLRGYAGLIVSTKKM